MGAGFNFKRRQNAMKATVEVQLDEYTNEYFIELPPDILAAANLTLGDTILWEQIDAGSWTIRKAPKFGKETKIMVRDSCNEILSSLVGPALVERWWTSPNKAFNLRTPESLWETDNWIEVYKYIKNQRNSDYS